MGLTISLTLFFSRQEREGSALPISNLFHLSKFQVPVLIILCITTDLDDDHVSLISHSMYRYARYRTD